MVAYYQYLCGLLDIEPGSKPEKVYNATYPYISVYQKDGNGAHIGSIQLGETNDALIESLEYEYVSNVREGFIVDDSVTVRQLESVPKRQINDLYYEGQPIPGEIINSFRYDVKIDTYYCYFDMAQNSSEENPFDALLGLFTEITLEEGAD